MTGLPVVRIDKWMLIPVGSVGINAPESHAGDIKIALNGIVTDHPKLGSPKERVTTSEIQEYDVAHYFEEAVEAGADPALDGVVRTRNTLYILGRPNAIQRALGDASYDLFTFQEG